MFRCSFRKRDHSYHFSERGKRWQVPSVSTVMRDGGEAPSYSNVAPEILKAASERGIYIHAWIEKRFAGKWPKDVNLPHRQEYQGYMAAWMNFERALKPQVLYLEKVLYHRMAGYAGRCDMIVRMQGKVCILDNKTYPVKDHVGEQLAAYRAAYMSMRDERLMKGGYTSALRLTPPIQAAYGLELKKDGKYKLTEFAKYNGDYSAFRMRLITVLQSPKWRRT